MSVAPASRMSASPMAGKYDKRLDRESAFEILRARADKAAAEAAKAEEEAEEAETPALREFNSHISAVAYPILYRNGQLLETRLIDDLPAPEGQV